MRREELPDGTVVFIGTGGCAVIHRLAPGVVLLRAVGEFEAPRSEGPMKEFDRELARAGSLKLFLDLTERRNVASSSRQVWVAWARERRHQIATVVLVRSKIVDMAIAVLGMLAGGVALKSYSEVAAFEAAIASVVPGFRRLPPLPPQARAASESRA